MPQESKPSIFKWAATGTNVAMDAAKQTLGWTAEKPMFQKVNWLFQQITQHLSHVNAYGIGVWDAATDYASGGVARGSNGKLYTRNSSGSGGGDPSVTPGNWTELVPIASETIAGKAEIADNTEARAFAADDRMMTPLKTHQALKGSNQLLAETGYQKLPGGLVIQWGKTASIDDNTTTVISFPFVFTSAFNVSVTADRFNSGGTNPGGSDSQSLAVKDLTTSGFTLQKNNSTGGNSPVFWQAIGTW